LGDRTTNPTDDESVTLKINATVKDRSIATSDDRTVPFQVDQDHQIDASNERSNSDSFIFHCA
jgi:hypothetical protein